MNSAEDIVASPRDAPETAGIDGEALRRRKPAHAATFADDAASPLPYIPRRGSTFRRNSSHRTESIAGSRRSADSFLSPRPTDEHEDHEPTLWHSTPLLFAILPAIGGVVFKRGSVLLTDLALLILAALYLNWCLVTPWIWYHSAQTVKVADFPPEEASLGATDDALGDGAAPGPPESRANQDDNETLRPTSSDPADASATLKELRMHELTALALCFAGPLLGSYILHIIRQQLSTVGDQMVSNLHLTLFVLGAEIRPLRYAMKMAQARTIYLQRLVREDPHAQSESDKVTVQDLGKRLNELEASFADKLASNDLSATKHTADADEAVKRVQGSLQTQIDALNRAVRRYEKRATAQTMQTEARLQDLDARLKETISLAAAAANYSQKPGVVLLALTSIKSMLFVPIVAARIVLLYPLQLTRALVLRVALRLGLVTVEKSARPAGHSRSSGDSSASRKAKKSAAKE